VKSELSRLDGVRLTLDGRTLTAEIVETPHVHRIPTVEKKTYGKRVGGACGTTFRPVRKALVFQRRLWPVGARSLTFDFRRDISRRVKWCLVDGEDGADVAFVSFVDREPARFLAKGRGPFGEWWRAAAWRGERLEPCLSLRDGADPHSRSGRCFDELAEHEATLDADLFYSSDTDMYVVGAVGRSATKVRVRLADGTVQLAKLYRRPRGSQVLAQFFVLALPAGTEPAGVRGVDAKGRTVGRDSF
jgi:hypothetical protein